ncbi:hypothetical protein [Halomonas sp. 3F2F]|uniref:hypothetical protein n=1 Tax=Halomonas sp. 3F2F TaxID=1255602 RepID=UPI001866DF59|nr:hypothetical protein [Halomonas sp. 3F2F]
MASTSNATICRCSLANSTPPFFRFRMFLAGTQFGLGIRDPAGKVKWIPDNPTRE